jgi:hypothetical protein
MTVLTLEAKNMRRATCLAGLAALLFASGAMAREAADDETASATAAGSERPHIRVLSNPYELSGFYSSGGSDRSYGFYDREADRYPIASYYRSSDQRATGRYPIASYYRSSDQGSIGYWRSQAWRRSRVSAARLRRARQTAGHRDFYLFVPAFLAPVVPLDERAADPR